MDFCEKSKAAQFLIVPPMFAFSAPLRAAMKAVRPRATMFSVASRSMATVEVCTAAAAPVATTCSADSFWVGGSFSPCFAPS
jgi:hypothetical protein